MGYLLHEGATVMCAHGGTASPTVTFPRVKVGGQAIVVQTEIHSISGCSMPPPPSGNGPCVTGTWIVGASRVTAGGTPVLLQESTSTCVPTGTPMQVASTQTRAKGQ